MSTLFEFGAQSSKPLLRRTKRAVASKALVSKHKEDNTDSEKRLVNDALNSFAKLNENSKRTRDVSEFCAICFSCKQKVESDMLLSKVNGTALCILCSQMVESSGGYKALEIKSESASQSLISFKKNKKRKTESVCQSSLTDFFSTFENDKIQYIQILEMVLSHDEVSKSDYLAILKKFKKPIDSFSSFDFESLLSLLESRFSNILQICRLQHESLCYQSKPVSYLWSYPICSSCDESSQLFFICTKCNRIDSLEYPAYKIASSEDVKQCILRGLNACQKMCKVDDSSALDKEFIAHGGDLLFLFRYVYLHAPTGSEIKEHAWNNLSRVMAKWDFAWPMLNMETASAEDLLVFSEGTHAKLAMHCEPNVLEDLKSQIVQVMERLNHKDLLAYECINSKSLPFLRKWHCQSCGKVNRKTSEQCVKCKKTLRNTVDYEAFCHAMVWAGLFRDLGMKIRTRSGECDLDTVMKNFILLRPYKSLDEIGVMAFKHQCYLITHLIFVMSNWGAYSLPRDHFLPEFLFLLYSLKIVIKLGDPEIAGELVQCLRILGMHEDDFPIQKGVLYLLGREKSLKSKGHWIQNSKYFYQRYHAIYCAIVGMFRYPLDSESKFPDQWRVYVGQGKFQHTYPPPLTSHNKM